MPFLSIVNHAKVTLPSSLTDRIVCQQFWGFCDFIPYDSYFVKSRTKVKTNLHIAVLKKLKSSLAKTVTSNDVFSPS